MARTTHTEAVTTLAAAVVDDDSTSRERLIGLLRLFEAESSVVFCVREFRSAVEFLDADREAFDIVFLDVDMPGVDGFGAAAEMRERDAAAVIIFVTHHLAQAHRGYAVDALGYQIKPVQYRGLALDLDRAITRIRAARAVRALVLRTREGVVRVPPGEVSHVESRGHYLTYHASGRAYELLGRLGALESELSARGFFRCHKGVLVNLAHVTRLDAATCTLTGGAVLPVSRHRRPHMLTAMVERFAAAGA